jgi:hypothetical protein
MPRSPESMPWNPEKSLLLFCGRTIVLTVGPSSVEDVRARNDYFARYLCVHRRSHHLAVLPPPGHPVNSRFIS